MLVEQLVEQPPPPLQWRKHWWAFCMERTLDLEGQQHFQSFPHGLLLKLGNDATGANGPWFALEGVCVALKAGGHCELNVEVTFTS